MTHRTQSGRRGFWGVLWGVVLLATGTAGAAPSNDAPALRLVPKPADSALERHAHPQPTVPDGAKEIPFDETAPEPTLTEPEKERGYLLFQRPLTESVYPNTRPLSHERLETLVAFATPGEFEPVTFALYPVRPLQNLKVRVSSLTSAAGEIPADRVDVRLATYWNVGYPSYTTLSTYRRVPELLERVTVHTSPAGECQWYWLTIHVPDDARPGLYRGTVPSGTTASARPSRFRWPCAFSASGCRRTRTSTSRPTSTCGTKPSTTDATRRLSAGRRTRTTGRWSTTAWICCRRFT